MRKIFKNREGLRNALFVFIIAFSAFLAFDPLFENLGQKASQEFASAIFGTIFAAVITMVLLSKQTQTEEEKNRSEKVFELKINLYNEVIDKIESVFQKLDANNTTKLTRQQIVQLEFLLIKMIMVGNEKTIHEFTNIYQNITNNYSKETSLLSLNSTDKNAIFRFANHCRAELGLCDKNIENEVFEDIVIHGELFYSLEQEEKLPLDVINTLKDIYGFLVFDLAVPSCNIKFRDDGFDVYNVTNSNHTPACIACAIENEGVLLTASNVTSKMKHFKFDKNNTLLIPAESRQLFVNDMTNIRKVLTDSYKR